MAAKSKEVPVKKEETPPAEPRARDLFTSLHDEVDRLFRDFSRGWGGAGLPSVWGMGSPVVDMIERDKEIEVHAELPGIDEKDIDLELSDDMLTIRAEKHESKEEGEKGSRYHLSERRYGSFERSLKLPESADIKKPEATFANGVLTVTFPKTAAALKGPRKVKVKSG